MGLSWVRREMVRSAKEGEGDVAAFLAGEVMPSAVARQKERRDVLLAAGGEIVR